MKQLKEMRGKMGDALFVSVNKNTPTGNFVMERRAYNYLVLGYSFLQIGQMENPPRGKDTVRDHVIRWLALNKEFVTDTFRRFSYVDGT